MRSSSEQTQAWRTEFGIEYTDRNIMTVDEMEELEKSRYGISRTDMNIGFIRHFDRDVRILEVGCNVGNQLLCLQRMGFTNLYGIDLSQYALDLAKSRTKGINLIWGSVLDIPFKDGYFDMVFTSALLIHINPKEIGVAMGEIYRCSRKWIWGLEYFAEEYTQIKYRQAKETSDLLWKANFSKIYLEHCENLEVEKMKLYKYQQEDNWDVMFLLEKAG